jgi:hypothetical protein
MLQKLRTRSPAPTRRTSEIAIFGSHERAAETPFAPAGAEAAPRVLQVPARIDSRHLQSGHEAEHDPGYKRQRQPDRDHAAVEPHFGQPRQVGRHHRDEPVLRPRQRRNCGGPAGERKDQTLDQQLAHELTTRRPERAPDRDFAHPSRNASQRKVCDVDARDHEQQSDGAHQHTQNRPDAIRQLVLNPLQPQAPLHAGRVVDRVGRS